MPPDADKIRCGLRPQDSWISEEPILGLRSSQFFVAGVHEVYQATNSATAGTNGQLLFLAKFYPRQPPGLLTQ